MSSRLARLSPRPRRTEHVGRRRSIGSNEIATNSRPTLCTPGRTSEGSLPPVGFRESLQALDLDGLAEAFNIAVKACRAYRDDHDAGGWRAVLERIVDEARTRPESTGEAGTHEPSVAERRTCLRAQLRSACAARAPSGT